MHPAALCSPEWFRSEIHRSDCVKVTARHLIISRSKCESASQEAAEVTPLII